MIRRFLWHWLTLILGLYIISKITPLGITFDSHHSLVVAGLVLVIFNRFLKPVLVFITMPLVVLTLGLFLLVINAFVLRELPHFVHGMHVPGFRSAFFGALLLSIFTGIFTGWEKKKVTRRRVVERRDDDPRSGKIIDI